MLSWNTTLFLSVNAASKPSALSQGLAAEAVASAPALLAPLLLACLWVWGSPARHAALIATGVGLLAGQGVNLLLGLVWFEPRPFMAGTSGLPSFLNRTEHFVEDGLCCQLKRELFDQRA